MVSSTSRPHFTPEKHSVLILQEAGWDPGPVWTGGKSRPHQESIPDCPARSQSLYRLSYPVHNRNEYQEYFLGGKGGRWLGLTTLHLHVPTVLKSGSLNLLEPSGPVLACNWIVLPLPLPLLNSMLIVQNAYFFIKLRYANKVY